MHYLVAAVAAISGILFGFDEGIIAGAAEALKREFTITPFTEGLMTASVPLGAVLGAAVSGRLTSAYGRRRILMPVALLFIVGSIIAAAAVSIWMLVGARLLLGIAVGVSSMAAPLYIAETAPKELRGTFVSAFQLAITVGILVSYLVNLALAGDDPACKSSTVPSQSEHALMDAQIPVLNPANVQDILDFGLYGWAMSRYSGCWVGMKCITENVDTTSSVLADSDLRRQWDGEVKDMCDRINGMRKLFVDTLAAKGVARDFSFLTRQKGMFSYSGLSKDQVQTLREKHAVYIVVNGGRINVAGMTETNMDRLCGAIADVV